MNDGGSADALQDATLDAPTTLVPGAPCETDVDCPGGSCSTENLRGLADGFCFVDCAADSDCPAGSHCGARGACLEDCTGSERCRSGYLCYDFDADSRLECYVAGTGTGPIGAACSGSDECAGGPFGYCLHLLGPDGVCSDSCAVDADCGAGAHCYNASYCMADCAANSDCDADRFCSLLGRSDIPGCLPLAYPAGLAASSICTNADECSGRGIPICFMETARSYGVCSARCGAGACAPGEHCAYLVSPDGVPVDRGCLADCTTDGDCAAGVGCVDPDEDGIFECSLSGVGTTVLGDPCDDLRDCAGGDLGVCLRVGPAGYCGLICRTEACPLGSECMPVGGIRACLRSCTTTADCAAGLTCRASPSGRACQP